MGKKSFDDDGRTVVNMDLEGTPWARKVTCPENRCYKMDANSDFARLNLTRKERWAMFWGAMGAIIPIAGAFIALYFLAFWLIDIIWLR